MSGTARRYPMVLSGALSYSCLMSKTERIDVRMTADDKATIGAAAELEHVRTADFVRDAAMDRAQIVRARTERTLMPAAQFDELIAALDAPDKAPVLARMLAHKRRFTQR